MKKFDIVLKNATIVNSDASIKKHVNIAIEKNKIELVSKEDIKGDKVIDCTYKVVSPTFVNGHVHSPMNILKGIAEDVSIDDWFNDKIWPYESSLNEEDIYVGSKLSMYEMINNGISIFADHYFFEDVILKASKEIGVRIDLAPTIFSGDDFQERVNKTLQLKKQYENDSLVDISFGPHSTYMCTVEDLKDIAKTAKENNMKAHLHIGETNKQLLDHKEKHGETPMQTLDKVDMLDNKLILAHSLHFDEEDLPLFKENHFIPLSAKTYMKLSMNFKNMLDNKKSLNCGLGTDGAASSNTLDIVEQARLLALFDKDYKEDATAAKLENIWKQMMKSHKFFKFNTGEIKEGSSADLIIWDLNKVNSLPNYSILASIIYSSDASNIESVLIDGNFVKKDNKVIGFDQRFIDLVYKQKERLLKVGKGKSNLKF